MRKLWRLFRRVLRPGAEPVAVQPPAEPPDIERAVTRLAEDEALREDLTDAQYGPILMAVSNLAVARGLRCASTDELYLALRGLVRAGVEAVRNADGSALLGAAVPPLVMPQERASMEAILTRSTRAPEQIAELVASALETAIRTEQ